MSGSFAINGTPTVLITGGPQRSIQVDSQSSTAFTNSGVSSSIDLHLAGPGSNGSDFGIFGGPTTKPSVVNVGTAGHWVPSALPYGDPWANVAVPTAPASSGAVTQVGFGVNGCPDPNGCVEFGPGDYRSCTSSGNINPGANGCPIVPVGYNFTWGTRSNSTAYALGATVKVGISGGGYLHKVIQAGTTGGAAPAWAATGGTTNDGSVIWQNMGWIDNNINKSGNTAIFDPGIYYIGTTGLQLRSNSTVRPSTAAGDGTEGTVFYFANSPSSGTTVIAVDSNSGKSDNCTSAAEMGVASPNGCIVGYKPDGTAGVGSVPIRGLNCSGPNPGGYPTSVLPSGTQLKGNILLGPCSGGWTAVSSDGKTYRGFLFFFNRSLSLNADWSGGGSFLLSGFMYAHSTSYSSSITLGGGTGAGAYALGNIVTDRLTLGGNSTINMYLNPATSYNILKPQLLQ